MNWSLSERLAPIFVMALVLFFSRLIVQHAYRRRLRTEAGRLRLALSVGFRALHALYAENAELLRRAHPRVVSGRHQISLIRSQLGRLACLEDNEVEAVMTACLGAERAECAMAMCGRTVGGAAFMISPQARQREEVRNVVMRACADLQNAHELLRPGAEVHVAPRFCDQAMTIFTPTTTSISEIPERTNLSGA